MDCFKGHAAIGIVEGRGGFSVYCCREFGYDEGTGRFGAMFSEYEAHAPMDADEAEDALRETCWHRVDGMDGAQRYELCEAYDCAPGDLAEAYFEDLVGDYGGDVFEALAAETDSRPFGEGEVRLECAAGGQHDAFSELKLLYVDVSVAEGVKRLWDGWHLKTSVPDDVAAEADALCAALAAAPGPEEAAAMYFAENPGCFGGR